MRAEQEPVARAAGPGHAALAGGETRRATSARVGDLLLSSHPGPTVAVTVFGTALAFGADGGAKSVLIGAAVLTGQLSIGWSNDWVDAARDAAVGRGDKPVGAGRLSAVAVRNAAFAAALACVVLSLATGWLAGAVHVVAVASAWSYNLLFKRTAWSWAPFALSFGLLPLFVALAVGASGAAWWAIGAGALLGVGAHGTNVLPDLLDDEATGIRGAPHRVGRRWTVLGSAAALLGATVLVVLAPAGAPSTGRLVLLAGAALVTAAGAAQALAQPRSKLPFLASIAVAALDVVLLVGSTWTNG